MSPLSPSHLDGKGKPARYDDFVIDAEGDAPARADDLLFANSPFTEINMQPDEFDAALAELGWKGSDFCTRAGLVSDTIWRWRKGLAPIPAWAGEYLRAMLAIQRLHAEFVAVLKPARIAAQRDEASVSEGRADENCQRRRRVATNRRRNFCRNSARCGPFS